jgi:hypothetical protein
MQQKTDSWRGQIRLPTPIANWVKERGRENFRSMNAEIIEIIRRFREQEETKRRMEQ